MIAWIAFGLSIFNLSLWVVFAYSIKKVYKSLSPIVNNLRNIPIYDRMEVPDITGEVKFPR
jgi:hypothetical protein